MNTRILCLHGHGSNSKVMETQTAALRRELDEGYEWVFVNGIVSVNMAPELEGFYSPFDSYFGYFSHDEPKSVAKALFDLENFVAAEGPFDIVMCVCVASSLIVNLLQKLKEEEQSPFKGAIFFNGTAPLDLAASNNGEIRYLESTVNQKLVTIPTANIWGLRDKLHNETARQLNAFFSQDSSLNLAHNSHTAIPGAADENDLVAAAQVVRQTVIKAITAA